MRVSHRHYRESATNDHIMAISSLPLSYCTNVHPGQSAAEVIDGISTCTAAAARTFNRPLAAGLRPDEMPEGGSKAAEPPRAFAADPDTCNDNHQRDSELRHETEVPRQPRKCDPDQRPYGSRGDRR